MILLVLSMHAADTYSPLGNWYFVQRPPLSTATLLTFAAWQTYLQAFFMGFLFFIAGLFVPAAFDRKGLSRFLRDRAIRLGIPVLLYMFCIGPVTEYYVAHSWTSAQPASFANEWVKHIRNGQFLQENGPLWFCLALLIFCCVYAVAPRTPREEDLPAPGARALIFFGLMMAAATFLVRALRPPTLLNLHFGDFPQYVLLFAAGIAAARGNWLPRLDFRRGVRWMGIVVPSGFAFWLALLIAGGAFRGQSSDFSGGWHWQSAGFSIWESFTCVAICFGLLVVYRDHVRSQGPFRRFLSANAFSVYVFHPPIVILGARLLWDLEWPPLGKFAALTAMSAVVSFALSELVFRRMPLLRRVL